jgi:PAS domain S-box-containing protein
MQSLRQVGLELDDLLDNLGNWVHVVDTQDRIVYANTLWLDRMHWSSDDWHHTPFAMCLPPEYQRRYQRLLAQVIEGKQSVDFETIIRTHNDELLILACHMFPKLRDDQVTALVTISREVTHATESHAELERIFRLSADWIGIITEDGSWVRVNTAWNNNAIVSHSHSNPNFFEHIYVDDRENVKQILDNFPDETNVSFECRWQMPNTPVIWTSWQGTYYPNRKQIYLIGRDISQQKEYILQLEKARIQLHAILDNSGASIYFKDRFGRYRLVNQEFASLLGETPESITGRYDEDVLPSEFMAELIAHDREVVNQSQAIQVEEFFYVNNTVHTFLSTKFPIFDDAGNVDTICSIATDITYRKRTEIQLALRNQAIEFSPSAISIADARLPDLPLIYTNPAFEANTGYSSFEAIGQNCRFLQGDDRDQPEITILREAIHRGETSTVTLRNYRKDGTLFYNELRLAPIFDDEGTLTHYVGISTDVTDRVRTEEKINLQNQELLRTNSQLAQMRTQTEKDAERILKQNEELLKINRALAVARKQAEDATRLKSQFLATMSHELRTPLNAIIGYTEIQLAGMTGDLTGEQRDYQGRVLANAEHLLGLINDVLDIAKIEAGRMEIVNKTINIRDWVTEVENQTQGLAESKQLAFTTTIDERMPSHIIIDPVRLRQIAINLLSNAIKFTSAGTIRLSLNRHGNDAWKLIVSDTGIGIPSHMQETIFEEFRQVDSSSQRKQGGTGLGLSIVRKLCLMMGGNIRVQSQVDVGSTFTIILPLVIPQQTTMEEGRNA